MRDLQNALRSETNDGVLLAILEAAEHARQLSLSLAGIALELDRKTRGRRSVLARADTLGAKGKAKMARR